MAPAAAPDLEDGCRVPLFRSERVDAAVGLGCVAPQRGLLINQQHLARTREGTESGAQAQLAVAGVTQGRIQKVKGRQKRWPEPALASASGNVRLPANWAAPEPRQARRRSQLGRRR